MSFRILGLILLIIAPAAFAQGRKPAVEDFVGIEVEHPEGTPQGTEGLFNFEKAIDKFELKKVEAPAKISTSTVATKAEAPGDFTTAISLAFLLGLPGIIWFFMLNNLRQKAHLESASNIEVLEKYRREKQKSKAEAVFNKAS